jgi:hypothetical protein
LIAHQRRTSESWVILQGDWCAWPAPFPNFTLGIFDALRDH